MAVVAEDKYLRSQAIDRLDLSHIVEKMGNRFYPLPRWPRELAVKCSELYKNFLYLLYKYPKEFLVPTRDIDEFWHNHILYTKEYAKDCQQIFGYFLHHQPGDPNNPEEVSKLRQQFTRTKELYLKEFGEPLLVLKREIISVA